ncbi:hypothetical protein JTB14_023020 [Gonioctena quinquepunctata]|nr:hypothetical protein JTB14_023020 [Gonioctena quinquepunctata]
MRKLLKGPDMSWVTLPEITKFLQKNQNYNSAYLYEGKTGIPQRPVSTAENILLQRITSGCTAKLLEPDAVPSVFLFPKHLIKKVPLPRRKILKKNEDTASSSSQIEVMDISYESLTPIAPQHLNFALRVGEKLE